MKLCPQADTQSVYQHGVSVWLHLSQLLNYLDIGHIKGDWKIPDWLSEYRLQIHKVLLPKNVIEEYATYHDCGKVSCIIDENGKQHFPNHAEHSYHKWLEIGGSEEVATLMKMDMDIHTLKNDGVKEFASRPQAITLLLTGLAEIHSNAKMFGGIASDSFKIKWKQINKRGKAICKLLFGEIEHSKMYVVVRSDISPGLQIAQAVHCAQHFQLENPHLTSTWMKNSDYICILGIENEASLQKLIDRAKSLDIRHYTFIEPDLGNQVTAVCFEPGDASKKLCSNLKLALKDK